jgi:hypothetical protein
MFIELMERAKIINDTNRDTFIDSDGYLRPEADIIIEYMFYGMVFDNRRIIDYVKENNLLKIERVLGLLLSVKSLDAPFNILYALTSAIEKLQAGRQANNLKLEANALYKQVNMYGEYQVRYVEYLWMLFLEQKDEAQKSILQNYISLVNGLTGGFFANKNDKDATPEVLFEMAFDNAKVKDKLANLGDNNFYKGHYPEIKRRRKFPCLIEFKKEFTTMDGQNYVGVECSVGDWRGVSAMRIKTQYKKRYDVFLYGCALKKLCADNKLIPNKQASPDLVDLLDEIDRTYGMDFRNAPFEYNGDVAYLESIVCDGIFKENARVYTPSMFDKTKKKKQRSRSKLADAKPKTLGQRFVTWLKNDWNKPYKWER